jgi:hypothetical protein
MLYEHVAFFFFLIRNALIILCSEIRLPEVFTGPITTSSLLWRLNRALFDPAGVDMRRS